MKKLQICSIILATLSAIPAMAASTTLTGVVTDSMCGKEHMMPDKSNAECTRACVKHGAKYAVVANGKVYELAGKAAEVGALAGQKVTVAGDLNGSILTVSSVTATK